MQVMDKRVIVSLPSRLYESIKKIAEKEYRSVSSLIRESVLDRVEEELTPEERCLIEEGRRAFQQGKGVHFVTRKVLPESRL